MDTNVAIRVSRVFSDEATLDLTAVLSVGSGPPHLSYWEPMVSGDASARILRQRSVFIIGRSFLTVDTDILSEIVVAKEDKEALRLELQILDFHEESLFQDLYGFAEAARKGLYRRLLHRLINDSAIDIIKEESTLMQS